MGIIEKVLVNPSLDNSWEALKDQRKIPNGLYLFSKIDLPEVIAHYLQDLANQGANISYFSVDCLPEQLPNFMKRKREPSKKMKKAKRSKLGKPSVSRPHVPLVPSSLPSKSQSYDSSALHLRQLSSSLPQPSSIYTHYEPTTSPINPSGTPTSNPPSPPLQKFNLTTTTLPISKAQLSNEPISPPSSTPSSPPYYTISSEYGQPDPQSLTLAQLQARALSTQNPPSEPETNIPSPSEQPPTPPSEPHIKNPSENPITRQSEPPTKTIPTSPALTSPTFEPEPTFPTLEEAVTLFAESSVEKIKSLSENSRISDDPSTVRIHWNRPLRTSPK